MLVGEPEVDTEFVHGQPCCIGGIEIILCFTTEASLEQPHQLWSSRVQRLPVDKEQSRWDLVAELVEPGHDEIHARTHAHVLEHQWLVGNEAVVRISGAIE